MAITFLYPPGSVRRLTMLPQSLFQLWAVILYPAPDRCVIDLETTLLQQFLNIAQRKRIAKIPPDCTKYEAGFGLSPFEDRGSGYHLAILSQPTTLNVATHPPYELALNAERALTAHAFGFDEVSGCVCWRGLGGWCACSGLWPDEDTW